MRDSYGDMETAAAGGIKMDDVLFFTLIIAVAASVSLTIFMTCFYWFRREQRRMQKNILAAIAQSGHEPRTSSHGQGMRRLMASWSRNSRSTGASRSCRFWKPTASVSSTSMASFRRWSGPRWSAI